MARTFKVALKLLQAGLAFLMLLAILFQASCTARAHASMAQEEKQSKDVMRLTVPDSHWHWRVERILEREDAVWIFTKLERSPGMAAQMITTLELPLPVEVPAKPRRVFVMGKTWAWKNDEPYEFVASFEGLIEHAGAARQLYPLQK